MIKKNHGMIGKKNASKNDNDKKLGTVYIRCNLEQKESWIKTAKLKNMTLSKWITEVLNNSIK